jgi:putative ABC transport system ATP-binding protein
LSIEHVGKTHRVGIHEQRVLADVCLQLGRGELIGIWGAHRSGKSTLLRIAAGLEAPDVGAVSFAGTDLAELSRRRRDRLRLSEIGLVRADGPMGRPLSALNYVAMPLRGRFAPREARRRALAMLAEFGVDDRRDASWHQLSDGEKTLVGLAHGVVREPRLLLVDEPSVGLDPIQQEDVISILGRLVRERSMAVLIVSCVLSMASQAQDVFTLSNGRLHPVRPGGEVVAFPTPDRQTG